MYIKTVIKIKVVILAAGLGSRLKQNIPKAMVKLNGDKTILDYQLRNLLRIFNLNDIHIVVGFKKDIIIEKYKNMNFVYNRGYNHTNTAKSLLMALKRIGYEDILWLNGDVVFSYGVLELIRNNNKNNLVCVKNCSIGEEEIKYTVDDSGYINKISKNIINGLGEAVGINFIKRDHLVKLISCLEICKDDDYFEKGLELAINEGIKFLPMNIQNEFCMEIDFREDLLIAKEILKKEGSI